MKELTIEDTAEYKRIILLVNKSLVGIVISPKERLALTISHTQNCRPFSLSIQPLTAFTKLSYGKRDFAEAEGRKTEKEERCMRRQRGGGRGKKLDAGPEGRNLAKETENQRGFA